MLHFAEGFHSTIARFTHDSPRCLGALLQRSQANLIGIGKAGFITAYGANTDALVDVVRAIFNDAVF
ncbi:hypothetical protein D3C71_2155450 [compost metagenome]